jgi:hypothetical protein
MSCATVNLAFYLKHFNDATIHTVLSATGYSNIEEYESLCRRTDVFPVSIDSRGLMTSIMPNLDASKYRVFEFSIHNLTFLVQETLMKNYIGMSLTKYELEYPNYNNIYVIVPYRDYYNSTDDSVSYGTEFSGWTYRMNHTTKNSYVIKPPATYGKVCSVSSGAVTFDSGIYIPTILETDLSGFSSPLYYSKTYKGWIASLSLKQELLSAGIVKRTRSSTTSTNYVKQEEKRYETVLVSSGDDVTEDLSKWQFHLNPSTQNSYVLYTSYSKLFKDTPRTWTLDLAGLDRPIYYNASVNGWVIGLRFKDALVAAGASYVSRTATVKVEADTDSQVGVAPSAVRLAGWQFYLNPTTQNSYVLTTSDSKLFKATPHTWTLDIAGLDRPVYYNETLKGWLVSLRFKDALLVSGASYVSKTHTDKVEKVEVDVEEVVSKSSGSSTLCGWQFRLNPTTKNSYVLSTTDSKLLKATPRTWTLDLTGLDRPVYYNETLNGWIVSLRFKDALLSAGAILLL